MTPLSVAQMPILSTGDPAMITLKGVWEMMFLSAAAVPEMTFTAVAKVPTPSNTEALTSQ